MTVYVVVYYHREVLRVCIDLNKAKAFIQSRCDYKIVDWEYHNSHGGVWATPNGLYNIQSTELDLED